MASVTSLRCQLYNEHFFYAYMQQYNDLIEHVEQTDQITFDVCPSNDLNASIYYQQHDDDVDEQQQHSELKFFNHPYLKKCYFRKGAYCACINYVDIKKHICNAFPVMLGSHLDLQLMHLARQESCCCESLSLSDVQIKRCKLALKCKCRVDYTNHCRCQYDYNDLTCKKLFAAMSESNYPDTYGYFVIGGRFCWLPYLLSNNREMFHIISNKTISQRSQKTNASNRNLYTTSMSKSATTTSRKPIGGGKEKCFIRYIYDVYGKGHLFKYEKRADYSLIFTHRDDKGVDHVNTIQHIEYIIEPRHVCWNLALIKHIFVHLMKTIRPIDELSNKLILSPAILLRRYLYRCKHNSNLVHIIYNGLWNKLISMTAENTNLNRHHQHTAANFQLKQSPQTCIRERQGGEKKKKKVVEKKIQISTREMSNIYRKPSAHQMGRREFFSVVTRINSQRNSSINIIPEKYCGFLCLLEKGTSIDAFNKQYSLLPDVVVPHLHNRPNLNEILDLCLREEHCEWSIALWCKCSGINSSSSNCRKCIILRDDVDHYVVANGGLTTRYKISIANTQIFFNFFLYIKKLNPYIEIVRCDKLIMLNEISGVAFKRIQLANNQELHLSVYELYTYFPDFINYISVYGPQCTLIHLKYLHYAKINKLLHGINYMKSRINVADYAHLALFAVENVCFFILDQQTDTASSDRREFLKLKTIFAADPFCTQDGYLMRRGASNKTFLFLRRFYLEVIYDNECKFIPAKMNHHNQLYRHAPELFDYLYIGEIQSSSAKLAIRKTQKIYTSTLNHGSGHFSHLIYAHFDYECIREADKVDVYFTWSILQDPVEPSQWILSIELYIMHINRSYDGFKLSNPESQKGLANFAIDLDMRYSNMNVDLVTSAFTIIGRTPIPQLLRMKDSAKNDNKEIVNDNEMCVLRNVCSDHKNINLMRFDNLTINMLQLNNANVSIYTMLQNTFDAENQYKFLPHPNVQILQLLLTLKKQITFHSYNGQVYKLI